MKATRSPSSTCASRPRRRSSRSSGRERRSRRHPRWPVYRPDTGVASSSVWSRGRGRSYMVQRGESLQARRMEVVEHQRTSAAPAARGAVILAGRPVSPLPGKSPRTTLALHTGRLHIDPAALALNRRTVTRRTTHGSAYVPVFYSELRTLATAPFHRHESLLGARRMRGSAVQEIHAMKRRAGRTADRHDTRVTGERPGTNVSAGRVPFFSLGSRLQVWRAHRRDRCPGLLVGCAACFEAG